MEKEIIDEVLEFRNERDWERFHTPENLAKSLSIEAGELLECFQWKPEYDKQEASEELAAILMAESMGVDSNQIIRDKLVKNRQKYPVDKSKGNSTKYNKF